MPQVKPYKTFAQSSCRLSSSKRGFSSMFAAAIAKAPGMRLGIVMFEQEHQHMEWLSTLKSKMEVACRWWCSAKHSGIKPSYSSASWGTSGKLVDKLAIRLHILTKAMGNRSKSKHVHMLLHSHTSFHICFDTYTSPSHLYEWNTISQETRLAAANDEWLFCQHQAFPSRTGQGHA